VTISRDEAESIARAAGIAAATETLRLIGVDPERPFEMQADFAHLRRWRLVVERSVLGLGAGAGHRRRRRLRGLCRIRGIIDANRNAAHSLFRPHAEETAFFTRSSRSKRAAATGLAAIPRLRGGRLFETRRHVAQDAK
jgi:hypothetical protein